MLWVWRNRWAIWSMSRPCRSQVWRWRCRWCLAYCGSRSAGIWRRFPRRRASAIILPNCWRSASRPPVSGDARAESFLRESWRSRRERDPCDVIRNLRLFGEDSFVRVVCVELCKHTIGRLMGTGGTVPLHRQRPAWLHPSGRVVDALLAVALVMLAALPLATVRAADGLAIRPVPPEVDLPRFTPSPAPALRDLPALSDGGQAAQLVADRDGPVDANALRTTLGSQAALLLGPSRAARLLAVVGSFTTSVQYDQAPLVGAYPYHYRVLDGLLRRGQPTVLDAGQRAGANDLAGLLLLAAAQQPQLFPNAAPAAFDLLDQAKGSGACLPQLNLAFLMATDTEANSANVTSELRRAADACPSDPTPLWLLGQYQLGELLPSEPVPPASVPMAAPAALAAAGPDPRSTFVTLERRFPGSPAGWSGEADAEVRAAAGLGLYREAADLQRRALTVDPHSLPLQARLIDYLEHAHAFVDAAAAGARFLAGPAD